MRQKIKRYGSMIAMILLIALLLGALISQLILHSSGSERYFSGDAEVYCEELIKAGFPEDYAVALTELHLLHPNWEFQPLLVTEQKPQYTWDYVIDRETEDGDTNVIYSSSKYAAYHHPTNREIYDSGYYQASRDTVEYFMDPRNFLNETDIFQFYALSGGRHASPEAVEAILKGTFMENTVLENGKSYAQYLIELGTELDVNPIFLAAKVRQEQGSAGTSPLISGLCGDKLWEFYDEQTQKTDSGKDVLPPKDGYTEADLKALNGYYNYFNVGATGTGVFKIYYNAMQYAKKGTASMQNAWGGSPSWNTRWKALYGGTAFLKSNYIDAYQSTIYLQKFNVDSRANTNFSKQYMTAVFGAMSEARSLYQSFAALDTLDAHAVFLIPVYGEMPSKPCADPANGSIKDFAQATAKYSYQSEMTSPERISTKSQAIYLTQEVYPTNTLKLSGVVTHDYSLEGLEYAWDGGEWQPASDGKNLNISLFVDFPENTSHILTVRGKATYDVQRNGSAQTIHTYFLYAVIYVNVIPPPSVNLTFEVGNTITNRTLYAGTEITLPECQSYDFAGWHGSDGSFLPSGAELTVHTDVTFSAIFLALQPLDGAALSIDGEQPHLRFSAVLDRDAYQALTDENQNAVSLFATPVKEGISQSRQSIKLTEISTANGKQWLRLDVETEPLSPDLYGKAYGAAFYVELEYSNGEKNTLCVSTPFTRSAEQVAQAAFADTTVTYSASTLSKLQLMTGNH